MSDLVFNVAKGRVAELYNRVKSNDPANSVLIVIPVDAGAVADATIRDCATFAAVLAAGVTERSTSGWSRKILSDADIVALTIDNSNDRVDVDIPDQTWTAPTAGTVTDLVICYDADSTSGTDANLIPLTLHDFPITPDGSDIAAVIASTGFYRAS